MISSKRQFIVTFFKYCAAAKEVPLKAGIFSVPITVETGKLGSKINAAGVCINPPPPTMASMNPAINAATQRKIIM